MYTIVSGYTTPLYYVVSRLKNILGIISLRATEPSKRFTVLHCLPLRHDFAALRFILKCVEIIANP